VNNRHLLRQPRFIVLFLIFWLSLFLIAPLPFFQLLSYASFFFLGIVGAIFANSTGAGGGVVFIPMFNQLGFSDLQAISTSFGIQCFGMTAGAITWCYHYKAQKQELRLWQGFKRIIVLCSIGSVIGLLGVYSVELTPPSSLHHNFSWFSLVLGIAIIATIYLVKPKREVSQLSNADWIVLFLISIFGGAITAWLSVGIGELVAIYLILRRFDTTMAVSSAVVISAITVWAGIWQHTIVDFQVYWQVVIFAGPGAILGGVFAKTLVTFLSATRLKLFFAFWLLVIGIVGVT
jgi:uncharacterized membrane protein YfcA